MKAETWVGSVEMFRKGETCPNLGYVFEEGLAKPTDYLDVENERKRGIKNDFSNCVDGCGAVI
jgi:hypothetical protein